MAFVVFCDSTPQLGKIKRISYNRTYSLKLVRVKKKNVKSNRWPKKCASKLDVQAREGGSDKEGGRQRTAKFPQQQALPPKKIIFSFG